MWLPDGICRLNTKSQLDIELLSNYRKTKFINQNENFHKKTMFRTLKV
jgi:hypothetical protein